MTQPDDFEVFLTIFLCSRQVDNLNRFSTSSADLIIFSIVSRKHKYSRIIPREFKSQKHNSIYTIIIFFIQIYNTQSPAAAEAASCSPVTNASLSWQQITTYYSIKKQCMKESNILAVTVTIKQLQRVILGSIQKLCMKESNILAVNVITKEQQEIQSLLIQNLCIKESNILAVNVVNNIL